MSKPTVRVSPDTFRSPLIYAAAVMLTLSAVLGLAGVVLLFDPVYADILTQKLITSGIRAQSALNMWYVINTSITILCFLCPAVTAVGLWTALKGRYARGMNLLSNSAQWLLWGVYGSAVITLVIFVYRLVRYILLVLPMNEAAYLLYSLLVSEGLMAVQAWLIFRVICKFLDSVVDTTARIGYTLSAGQLDTAAMPAFTSTGLLILAFVCIGLAADRLYTVTIVQDYIQDYYKLLTAAHPGQYLAAGTLLTAAAGNILLFFYLRRFRRIYERIRFDSRPKIQV